LTRKIIRYGRLEHGYIKVYMDSIYQSQKIDGEQVNAGSVNDFEEF